MITAQDIKEKTFEKATFGGYSMAAVDDFLDDLSTDMALLQKENAVLKGKMKVLVEKIEEYRSNEDALRMAILSAQKMGNMIEKEAQEKSDKMISDAMADAARITKEASLELDMEKARLDQAQRSGAQFIENMELLCRKQMDFLTRLKDTDFVKEAQAAAAVPAAPAPEQPVVHETVKSIEETIDRAASEPVSDVRPDIAGLSADADDSPTRAFDIVSAAVDAEDAGDKTTRFSFDDLFK